jgi:formamidopyrimidine-DNA glycosylase
VPELPEVQAHAERMTQALAGKTLEKFQLLNFASLKTFSPAPDQAVGATLTKVGRRAKVLQLRFDNGHVHVVHLMQGGRLRPDPKQTKKPRLGLARWVFEGNDAWLFTEAGNERKAGIWTVDGDPDHHAPLAETAPDCIDFSLDDLVTLCGSHSGRIHGMLRDQRKIAGLGRMLTNEILFDARISPFANASKLTAEQVGDLYNSMQSVVAAAIDHERTLDDIGKSADRPSKVHNRADEPCVHCDNTIRTVEYRNYTVYYCPTDQTGGKILADNTTSKFLK